MKIHYHGHAWFSLISHGGAVVCCDPFDPSVGYPMPELRGDVVTISHGHRDHNYVEGVQGDPLVCKEVQAYETPFAKIQGHATWHDGEQGTRRGANIFFVVEMDGVRVAHAGDLGHMPDEETLQALGQIDVLLVPVGGFYTIDAEQAVELTRRINPRYVIPMHYKTQASERMPITTEAPFLTLMKAEGLESIPSITVEAAAPSTSPQVLLLDIT